MMKERHIMRTFIVLPQWTLRPVARCGIGAHTGRWTNSSTAHFYNNFAAPFSPICAYALSVTTLPRGVRSNSPNCIKYGS